MAEEKKVEAPKAKAEAPKAEPKKKELTETQKKYAKAVFSGASRTREWGGLSKAERDEVIESGAVEAVGREGAQAKPYKS